MALTAKDDLDRTIDGIATGNVITGANTLTGNAGKDTLGVAPTVVSEIRHLATTAAVAAGGVDIAGQYGILHINPNGSYSYTRTTANIYEVGAPSVGAIDVFSYTLTDKANVSQSASLIVNLLAAVSPTYKAATKTHSGTAFDDFIDAALITEKVDGGAGQDKIIGGAGANTLSGGAGNDWLVGLASDDVLEGGAGADRLEGGTESDTASYAGSKAGVIADLGNAANNAGDAAGDQYFSIENLIGSGRADTLTGNALDNKLLGSAGNDSLFGNGGYDTLSGGAGADKLNGGSGVSLDTASYEGAAAGVTASLKLGVAQSGEAAGDTYFSIENLIGSKFNDKLHGDDSYNDIVGGAGNDVIYGYGEEDFLYGGLGNDTIDGGDSDDEISGEAGADILHGGLGGDDIAGGTENDKLYGDAGDDELDGEEGDDTFYAGEGADRMYGDIGEDIVIYAGDPTIPMLINLPSTSLSTGWAKGDDYYGIEWIVTGAGNDTLFGDAEGNGFKGSDGTDTLLGNAGHDRLYGDNGNDVISGNADNDTISGGAGNDQISGGTGHDYIFGDLGADQIDGGDGDDHLTFVYSTAGLTINLQNAAHNAGAAKGDTYLALESYALSNFADKFYGSTGADFVDGLAGNDVIDGHDGDDFLGGSAGNDTLIGGGGNDVLQDNGGGTNKFYG
ncbi:MAG TPA: calcium-binding protein, partial [Dongiaceae bacterium]|nr:calcium-binding protein [Dongiaceae bacterium]